ncbi:unnamed protein product [Brachionus calyciflorus]|uniref:Uncharacterized protein n=1 Tax=Brachionus calyciflorus TaxID=104777 RepID=A0A814ICP5_9BILA|nr:unnamed protein product [Brachionus calyciflorus]
MVQPKPAMLEEEPTDDGRFHQQHIDANATASNVNLISALHFNMEQPNKPNNVRSSCENLNEIKIPLLTEDSCLGNWMDILEHNLKRKENHEWVEIALTHMNEKIISKLKDLEILLNSSNGFEQLKKLITKNHNGLSKQEIETNKTINKHSDDEIKIETKPKLSDESVDFQNRVTIDFNQIMNHNLKNSKPFINEPIVNENEKPSTIEVIDDTQAQKTCFSGVKKHYELNEVSQSDEQILKKENELSIVLEKIINELKTISATYVTELTPQKNMDIAFKIELSDPKQQPLTTKSRPLPYNLKQKVQEELNRQLKAGIIRKSRMADSFSRLPAENEPNLNSDEDYNEKLVAVVEGEDKNVQEEIVEIDTCLQIQSQMNH